MANQDLMIILGIAAAYLVLTSAVAVWAKKGTGSTSGFMTGGKEFGVLVIAALLVSEWVGTGSTMGIAETAYSKGISAAWNLITIALAFILFGLIMARNYQQSGEYTLSGMIEKKYGKQSRTIVSLITIYAALIVNVSMYVGGAATLATLLKIPTSLGNIITGVIAIIYVTTGGIKSVAYTNLVHAIFKLLGVTITVIVALKLSGGWTHMQETMPPIYFSWTGIGVSTIIAWTIANIGAVFSTQSLIQAIGSISDSKKAIQASILSAIVVLPIGIGAAVIGVAAHAVYPNIKAVWSFPQFVTDMNPWLGGIVVASLMAAVFGSLSGNTLGATALFMRDFYKPWFNPDAKHEINASRVLSIVFGLLPIPFAMFMPELLKTTFFARALRTTLTVIAIGMFYLPYFNSGRGVFIALLASVIGTTGWYLAGDPWGIDNIYISLLIPVVFLVIDHFFKKDGGTKADEPAALIKDTSS